MDGAKNAVRTLQASKMAVDKKYLQEVSTLEDSEGRKEGSKRRERCQESSKVFLVPRTNIYV